MLSTFLQYKKVFSNYRVIPSMDFYNGKKMEGDI